MIGFHGLVQLVRHHMPQSEFWHQTFDGRLISRNGNVNWPSRFEAVEMISRGCRLRNSGIFGHISLKMRLTQPILFLKNISPSKRVVCFILNNLHFPMQEGIAFYALHKSRVLIIPCKADGFCLFIGLPDEI